MTSIKNKIPLIALIILICVLLFFTLWDIAYGNQLFYLYNYIVERQMLQRILILYIISIIFTVILIFSLTIKKYKTILRSRRTFEKSLESKLLHFKCPKCNEIFSIQKFKDGEKKSFTTTCPCCGVIGRISYKSESIGIKI